MIKDFLLLVTLCIFLSCNPSENNKSNAIETASNVELVVLGNVQDGGSPHIGCKKKCCKKLFTHPDAERQVVCLGLIDRTNQKTFLFEATPDITQQLKKLKNTSGFQEAETPDGIFLTHAHIGHYSGLMLLGKEALGTSNVPVYAMPRMDSFLRQHGPWKQLVDFNNIDIKPLRADSSLQLTSEIQVIPFIVPHRDEFSETVGYKIIGPNKSALFIPDIDKWSKWNRDIKTVIRFVDYAFVDGTFFEGVEIAHRDISEIPHPFVEESLKQFNDLPDSEKSKIHFIHFNHTNQLLNPASKQTNKVVQSGFKIARYGNQFDL